MRTRIPPALKWLLNERAALTGELVPLQDLALAKERRIASLEAHLKRQLDEIHAIRQKQASIQARIEGMDATMGMIDAGLDPGAAGLVKAWAGRHGARGNKRRFIVDYVKNAHPAAVSTPAVVQALISNFGLFFRAPEHRNKYRKDVATLLKKMVAEGLIEQLAPDAERCFSCWRWKGNSVPSLSDLHRLACAEAVSLPTHGPDPHHA